MTVALARLVPEPRRSVPAPGASLVTATEAYAVHIRAAVEAVRRSFGGHESVSAAWSDILASRWREEPLAVSGTPYLSAGKSVAGCKYDRAIFPSACVFRVL